MNAYVLALLTLGLAVPGTLAHDPMGTPKLHCEAASEWIVHDYGPGIRASPYLGMDSNVNDCGGGLFDSDGHREYGIGGALIAVNSGIGEPSSDPQLGAGSEYCAGVAGHHGTYGPAVVVDALFEEGASFIIAADTVDSFGWGEGCGDGETDVSTPFVGTDCPCYVRFPPGLDGTYVVFVEGGRGHVTWS